MAWPRRAERSVEADGERRCSALDRWNVLQLGCQVGAVEADRGAEELIRLHRGGARGKLCDRNRADAAASGSTPSPSRRQAILARYGL
ncbi:hypothetical protein I552_3397 [Mycobacterium xenopi 3993]|nr:hypothetical protein I552_3397 [Mycobacterium xenopi 3993]